MLRMPGNRFLFLTMAILYWALPAWPQQTAEDLRKLSVASLMNMEVTSASKKAENLSDAPAAIFVVTGDDIRRGGFSSVPDALRVVPGLDVSQQSAHVWRVSARGFSQPFNNKMLVLIDGRLVYSPTFGGVWWDVQDPPLEDIERIEVIRGPCGTLWGANAVNGVINIITKEAVKTQGELVSASAGVNEGYAGRVRYGNKVGTNLAYGIYGTSNDWLPTVNAGGAKTFDTWSISQGGMREDWNASQKDTVTFDGAGYSGRIRDVIQIFSPASPAVTADSSSIVKGGHVLGRWKHAFNDRSSVQALGYCDWTFRSDIVFNDDAALCDIELQHDYSLTDRQSLTWGGSVTTITETKVNSFSDEFLPPTRRDNTYSAFLQYDLAVVPDKLRLIAGSKFDHNNYTGFEYQPQIRVVWTPRKSHSFWAAVSRAVRTPTRVESDLFLRVAEPSSAPATFIVFTGGPAVDSEVLHAYELGYRYVWKQKFSLDATLYYNDYDKLTGQGAPNAPIIHANPFYIDVPIPFANLGNGQTHGLELYLKYAPVRQWTVSAGITELRGNSPAGAAIAAATNNPRQQVNLQSRLDATRYVNFDAAYYYYDAIPHQLPPVNRVDLGGSTKPLHGFTFSVWGRNLQTSRHFEATPFILLAGEIRRSVTFKLMWESNEKGTP